MRGSASDNMFALRTRPMVDSPKNNLTGKQRKHQVNLGVVRKKQGLSVILIILRISEP